MNYKCIAYKGGGIFSILMDLVIPHLYCYDDIDNVYIEIQENEYGCPQNGFDFVLDQTFDESYKVIHCGFIGHVPIDEKVKAICKKIKIKENIRVQAFRSDLGVHFRGGDMDKTHPEYGIFKYKDYQKRIQSIIDIDKPDQIFIASDNHEVNSLMQKEFGSVFNTEFIRATFLKDDTFPLQVSSSPLQEYWEQAFIDMLCLSLCDSLLCRTSNFSNAAIAFSDTLTKIYKL
jgi:hypothetical protein